MIDGAQMFEFVNSSEQRGTVTRLQSVSFGQVMYYLGPVLT